jgi:hypothetical protein
MKDNPDGVEAAEDAHKDAAAAVSGREGLLA